MQKIKSEILTATEEKSSLMQKIKDEALSASRLEADELQRTITERKAELVELDEKILLQSFALYQPIYNFATSIEYKQKLDEIRELQKAMLKNGTAAVGAQDWQVNGSRSKGRKMINDMQKLLLRAFNSECEYVTWKVKYNNFDSCLKRIENSYRTIQKLGVTMSIEISPEYFDLKVQELHLALEYQQAKERERELQREFRERQREEIAAQKELEEARLKMEKEHAHFQNALEAAKKQFKIANETERAALSEKIAELETRVAEAEKNLSDIDYREANQRAGYVYVISNIGAFGEDVYKIGMTRRLNPQERIDELGGASVPFKFDVHAMIFSDDAPKLEAALHRAFERKKLNLINPRREFFRVTLDDIERVVRENFDRSVEFVREAQAEQFRESERLRR